MLHSKKVILSLLIVSLLVLPLACAISFGGSQRSASGEGIDLVKEVWQIIQEDHVNGDSLDSEQLAEGAIEGLIKELDDPYTSYLSPDEYKLSELSLEGKFSGIGATITIKDDQLTVVAPFEGSPAEEAGIRPGDKILEVNGESTEGMGVHEAALTIRGERGTKVVLTVLHPDAEEPVELEITRDEIEVPSVRTDMVEEDIAHIWLTGFTSRTKGELKSALEDLSPDVKGIVLDLRDNPGGMLDAAIDVASQFLEEGIVLYAMDNEGTRAEWEVKEGGLATDIPLAVLVNGNSASASEVVAGAFQDHERGPIIGVKTFGKGSMNHVYELSNGGALYVTYANWFTPDGRQIEGKGVEPGIRVEMPEEDVENDRDPQLERAIEYLKQKAEQPTAP
ncbi:MAG: S41 family peptidase [Dehalococcoidia bacterium]